MATLLRLPGGEKNRGNKNREGKFYARVNIPRPGQRPKQKVIPLRTEDRLEAAVRLEEVENVEDLIKGGVEYSFPWMGSKEKKVQQLSVKQALEDYLRMRENEGLRKNTLEMIYYAGEHFKNAVGPSKPLATIDADDIQVFIRKSRSILGATSINMYLRNLRAFFNRAKESGIMSDPPKIKELPEPDDLPVYLSNSDFHKIQDAANNFLPGLGDIFWFYRETGARLSEPLDAELKGSFLIIHTENAKGKRERQIQLSPDLIQIYEEMKKLGYKEKYYSARFRAACKAAGIKGHKFHHLRHTFGVRTWLQTGDIFLVKTLMGHRSIESTLKYTNFFLNRLKEDFPDLAGYADNQSIGRAEIIAGGPISTKSRTASPYTIERIRKNGSLGK